MGVFFSTVSAGFKPYQTNTLVLEEKIQTTAARVFSLKTSRTNLFFVITSLQYTVVSEQGLE
jgi:hypothetical protein